MSRFDVNNAGDFARLTMGSGAGVLQALALAGRDPTQWDILEGSYNGVLFHVFQSKKTYQAALAQIRGSGGRRKAKFIFPYRNGQTTDDMGQKAEVFNVEILIHGPHYLDGYRALQAEFNKPTPGTLIHPVRGTLKVVVEDVEETFIHEKRNAVELRVVFSTHDFTIGSIRDTKDTSVKGALSSALAAFAAIDAAVTNVTGAISFATSLKNQIVQALNEYKLAYGDTLTQLNKNFNTRGSNDIPGLLPVNQGGTGTPGNGATFPLAGNSIDDETSGVIPALAASEMTQLVNQRRADLAAVITQMLAADALGLYDSVVAMKNTAVLMQDVLEKGVASSQAQVVDYTTPRDMSLREVAFANGLSPNKSTDIAQLNPGLLSVNLVLANTQIKVPMT